MPKLAAVEPGYYRIPLPQVLTLTAIVITFAVSAFLLALIYRSWQLGQADTVVDDEADRAVRERGVRDEDRLDDDVEGLVPGLAQARYHRRARAQRDLALG